MIDWNNSAKINNMDVETLDAWFRMYPKSQKIVVAICDGCGKKRKINFHQYREMCLKCARNVPEAREANSYTRNKFFREHPEAREAARIKSIKQFSDPAARNRMSEIGCQGSEVLDRFNTDFAGIFILFHFFYVPENKCKVQIQEP